MKLESNTANLQLESGFGLSSGSGLEAELLNLFDFKLENDISLQPQTTAQEFSLEVSLMMRKMDNAGAGVGKDLPDYPAAKTLEEKASIESFLTDPTRVPLHLGDVYSALQQLDKNLVAFNKKPDLPPRSSEATAYKSPPASPFMALDLLEAPTNHTPTFTSSTPVDTSDLSWENFLNNDESPAIDFMPIRLSISESLRSSASLQSPRSTLSRSFSTASAPLPKSKSKNVRFAEDEVNSIAGSNGGDEDSIAGSENLNVSAIGGSFEDVLASQDTKKIVMSPTIALVDNQEGMCVTSSTTEQSAKRRGSASKKRFSGMIMLTSMFEKITSTTQSKLSQQSSTKKSHGSHEYSTSPLSHSSPRSRSQQPPRSFPAPPFHEKSPAATSSPIITAGELIPESVSTQLLPLQTEEHDVVDDVAVIETVGIQTCGDGKVPIQSKVSVSVSSCGIQTSPPSSLTNSTQTDIVEAPVVAITPTPTFKPEMLDMMCQTMQEVPVVKSPVMVSESMQTEQFDLVINTQTQKDAPDLLSSTPSTLVAISPQMTKRTLSVSTESVDSSSDETLISEKNRQQQMEIQYLQEENMRLLQELNAMKLIVTMSRAQTQQMSILKEAAESRFEQLARVAHRKLLRAMVEANDH